jgi:hypothetical protein
MVARFSTLAAEGAGHIYRLAILDATDRVLSVRVVNTADAGMTTVDIGIWTPSGSTSDPVVVDLDGLAVDINLSGAQATPIEALGAGNTNQIDFGKALWEYAPGGPATQPAVGTKYEICAVPGGNPAGAGDYTFTIVYVSGA